MRGCSDLTAWWHFSNSATTQVKLLQLSKQDKTDVVARGTADMYIQVSIADVPKKVIIPDCSSQLPGNKCIYLSVSHGLECCMQVCSSSHALVLPGSEIHVQACSTTSICLMMTMMMTGIKILLEFAHFSIAMKQTHLKSRYGGRHCNLFKLGCQRKASKGC